MEKFRIKKMTEGDGSVAIWQVSGDIEPKDINEAIYAAMCEAGQDILRQSVCRLSGEHTAVELAGRISGCIPVFDIPKTMAPDVRINVGLITVGYKQQAPMFTCSFRADTVFEQIAEHEGVMSMAPKKYHRFKCVTKEDSKDIVLKNYTRWHGYHPRTISYKAEHDRINRKFETLGKLYKALSAEGMRMAYTVLCAAHKWDKADYDIRHMAKQAMLLKLWKDYGNCERLQRREKWLKGEMLRMSFEGHKSSPRYKDMDKELADIRSEREALSKPIDFSGSDFKYGPACYMEADQTYYNMLVRHFEQMLLNAPKPEWPVREDVVTIKPEAQTLKKHQGRHLVDSISPRLSADGSRIEWTVAVSVGRCECEHFLPGQLEPVKDEPKKKAKKSATKPKASKPEVKAQAPATGHQPCELSLSERLRQALLARLAA